MTLPKSSAVPVCTPIRILFVEDSEFDYELMRMTLESEGFIFEGTRVEDEKSMRAALTGSKWDAIISDHNLPGFSSGGALQLLRESGLDLPFMVVSGESGEEVAVEALLAGADDYILKERLKRLAPALRRSLGAAAVRRERTIAEEALRQSEARLHDLAEHLEAAKEIELAAVATEISEEIGSSLTALKFELAWLQRRTKLSPEEAGRLADAIAIVERTTSTAQRVVGNLRPTILDQGIVPALEWLTSQFAQSTGIEVHFDANREVALDPAVIIGIYRVCQESLKLVATHSSASRVDVHLFNTRAQIHLEVTDNGKVWASADDGKPTLGIASMRERARNLSGTLDISTAPSQGTTVLLSLPSARYPSAGSIT
jgi:signal transduction histidine kinase